MKVVLLIFIVLLPLSYAQKKARNDDLRQVKTSFSIKNSDTALSLNSENGSYFFIDTSKKKHRVSTEKAKETETEFSSIFLKFKYEMGEVDLKCKAMTVLVMYGEDFKFCSPDEKRTKILAEYIAKLNKYLK